MTKAATAWNQLAAHIGRDIRTGQAGGQTERLALNTSVGGQTLQGMLQDGIKDDPRWAEPALRTLIARMPELSDSDAEEVDNLVANHFLPSEDAMPAAKGRLIEALSLTRPESVVSSWETWQPHMGKHAKAAAITALCLAAPEDGHRLLSKLLQSKGLPVLNDAAVTSCVYALWASNEALGRSAAQEHDVKLPEGPADPALAQAIMGARLEEIQAPAQKAWGAARQQTAIQRRLGAMQLDDNGTRSSG